MIFSNFLSSARFPVSAVAVLFAIASAGCSNNSISEIEDLETMSLYSQTDQLAQTMEYIRSMERYEQGNFRDKVNSGLNRWMNSLSEIPSPDWKLPEIATSLPEAMKSEVVFTHVDDTAFFSNDADYLQQVYWFREIARRVSKSNFIYNQEYLFQVALEMADEATRQQWEESENLLFEAVRMIHPELASEPEDGGRESDAARLATAIKLFDWTVRNVHLQEARAWPDAQAIGDQALVEKPDPDLWPPLTGTPGPGYLRFPWQVLTYARGDFLDRARIFASLCHQIDIPVAVLAVPAETESRPYREWLCAVTIDDRMYLFDPRLGMPVHGSREGSIATLSEVIESPALLRELDLTVDESVEKMTYPVTAEMLQEVTALVVAAPEAISRRMSAVENNLSGDFRLKLTVDADQQAAHFRKFDGISDVKLWHTPYSTHVFRERFAAAIVTASYDSEILRRVSDLANQEMYIDRLVLLRTARNGFLRGVFRSDPEQGVRSAISYYYGFMYTDKEISQIERDPQLQSQLGVLREAGQNFAEWEQELRFLKDNMARVRADAAFFLAMCHYENGFPATALKWLDRLGDYDDDARWAEYLPYHSARAYEAIGDYDQAAAAYGRDKSPQRHGSILRKRWMESMARKSTDDS